MKTAFYSVIAFVVISGIVLLTPDTENIQSQKIVQTQPVRHIEPVQPAREEPVPESENPVIQLVETVEVQSIIPEPESVVYTPVKQPVRFIPEPEPIPEPVVAPKSNCDPNYTGACVPIASDVDCAGGSGNGPAYVRGPVYVVGRDIYGLDRDGDGVGCEK
jgi:hypothetical protein